MKTVRIAKGRGIEALKYINNRNSSDFKDIDAAVAGIIERVRSGGDSELKACIREFDGLKFDIPLFSLSVDNAEIEIAFDSIEDHVREALETAAENIRGFHEKQLEKTWMYDKPKGIKLGQLITPIENIGVYVPGGKAAYPSTVLMNVIPAVIAGVERIAIATPPQKDGSIDPVILAAAKIAGAHEIYRMGGAHAIAAFAYGTESVPQVDKITGPGNAYVARAKRMVYGTVDIDMIAGPSEICIIADDKADPRYIAADLLSQAEHDEMACSILITTSNKLASAVATETENQITLLERKGIAAVSIENNCVLYVADDIDSCFEISNLIAPEHLEIMLEEPLSYMDKVRNAGAVFFGMYSPEPLGDYLAGPNHTLPTSGTARFASPLGVYDFQKRTSIIYYTKEALENCAGTLKTISDKEGLSAHANAVNIRIKE